MQHSAQPGYISVCGSKNLPCFPACALLADSIPPTAQVGSAEPGHVLSYFPPNPDWSQKHPDQKWVVGTTTPPEKK